MTAEELLNQFFDDLLFQIEKGNTHENLEKGRRYEIFEQLQDWKSRFAYSLSIYSNDHLINGKPHFHFDNKAKAISATFNFDGVMNENRGKNEIPSNILKELKYFLSKPSIQEKLTEMWNLKNPELK